MFPDDYQIILDPYQIVPDNSYMILESDQIGTWYNLILSHLIWFQLITSYLILSDLELLTKNVPISLQSYTHEMWKSENFHVAS